MAINSSVRTVSVDSIEGIVGSKNYVKSNFESNTTSGWSLFNTSLTGGLPSGTITTGAASLALSTTAINPIEGSYSLQLTAASTATAGQGFISDVFTLQNSDLGKVINSKFSYNVVSGATNLNFSGVLGSQTIAVAFYDVTAAAWIAAPSGGLGLNQSSNYADSSPITFQSSVTVGQQYRMAVYFSQASVGAATLTFDSFICSRTIITTGAAMTDWVSFTPTGSWTTNTVYTGKYRRIGDSAEFDIQLNLTGAPNATALLVNIPLTVDANKITSGSIVSGYTNVGSGQGLRTTVAYYLASVALNSNTSVTLLGNGGGNFSSTFPTTWASPDVISMTFTVPIVGWSSNVQQSSDSDQRTVAAYLVAGGSQTIPNATATGLFFTSVTDTHGAFNGSNIDVFPVSGFYEVIGKVEIQAGATQSIPIQLFVTANGSGIAGANVSDVATASKNTALGNYGSAVCSTIKFFNAGVSISMSTTQYSGGTQTINGDSYLQIKRLSGSAVVQNTESVNAAYYQTSSQTIAAATQTIINFDTKDFDSHSAVTTGASWRFTPPTSGKYRLSYSVTTANNSWGAGQSINAQIFKTGIAPASGATVVSVAQATGTFRLNVTGSQTFALLAGVDYLDVRFAQSVAAPLFNGAAVFMSVERVGN